MRDLARTILFAAAAGVLALGAIFLVPRQRVPETFNDQGQLFYPEFTDPAKATSLEISEYDETAARPRTFKVELRNGRWSIPSHHGYPADARDRLAKTAESAFDLRKDAFRSDRQQDLEEFGVIDPLDEKATKGFGKHVTFRDAGGAILADYIFGKETNDGSGMRFVRLPNQKRTYAVRTKGDFTARFGDWIEKDLLKLTASSLRRVTIDNYTLDRMQGIIIRAGTYDLTRDDSNAPWQIGELTVDEEINTATVNELVSALSELKIVGVRRKPPGMTRDLKAAGDIPLTGEAARSLDSCGFMLMRDGNILSNEGEIDVKCDDGVTYTLRFGSVIFGEGDDVTAGSDDPKGGDKTGGAENRHLLVVAGFDESALPPAPVEPVRVAGAVTPEQQKALEESFKKEKEEYDKKKKERDDKVAAGRKRAQSLTDRFADWYYVISADYFKKLRRGRADLVKPKEAPKTPEQPKAPESPK